MRKPLYLLVFVLALSLFCASAQTGSSNSGTSQAQTQSQQPTSKDPTTPSSTGTMGSNPSTTPPNEPAIQSASTTSSSDLQTQIQNALKNEPTLANDNINVSVTDNEIDLSGAVANAKARQTAKRIAQSYAGNRKVKEHLTVGGQDNVSNPVHNNENPASNPDSNPKPSGNKPPKK